MIQVRPTGYATDMATRKQTQASKRNITKAQRAATQKRTIANLSDSTRRGLQREARKGARRGGQAGHALEDRNRRQLYEVARKKGIAGRSKMGKSQLIAAIRRAG
jgi:Rho termination factor, N-terminal domain